MTISRNVLCKRLMALGFNKHLTHRMVNDVEKWLKRNGPEWTITRLKDAKAYYLSKLAGKEPEMATWWSQKGPKGCKTFKSAWLNLPQNSEEQLAKAMCACNAYTLFINPGTPTPKQLRKFYGSVEQEKLSLTKPRDATELLRTLADASQFERGQMFLEYSSGKSSKKRHPSQQAKRKLNLPRPFYEHIYSDEKRAPTVEKSQKDVEAEMKWVADNITSPAVMGLLYKYRGLASAAGFTKVLHQVKINTADGVSGGGNISYLQEPGYKLRAIANPFRVHQVILDPLKKELMRFLKSFPTDCTHDQAEGQRWAQEKLREGRTVHAVDLSDATNNIPFEPQVIAMAYALQLDLHDKTTSDTLSYFIEVSRSTWKDPDNKLIRWSRGQPLGLGPSFGSFALWHGLLLRACHRNSGSKYDWNDCFRTVGDDVVIACDDTHRQYRKWLDHMDIPVSEAKCISSNKCTEFAGEVITPSSRYAIPKWKSLSDRNFLDVLKFLGPKALSWCKPRQRLVAKILAPVPELYGGLGWNPKGIPMEDRVEYAVNLGMLEDSPEVVPTRERTLAAIAIINNVCKNGDVSYWSGYLNQKLNTSLTPTGSELRQVTIDRSRFGSSIATALEELKIRSDTNPVFSELDSYDAGPVDTGDPRGKTRLESLESKLKSQGDIREDAFGLGTEATRLIDELKRADADAQQKRFKKLSKSKPKPKLG